MKPKVSIVRCGDYSYENVLGSVNRAVRLLGGIKALGGTDNRVLLKVNLLRPSTPEKAVVTHPMVVKAAVQLFQSEGFDVVIGDSPGGPMMKRMLKYTYKLAGLIEIAEETGAELNYDVSYEYVPHPEGKLIKGFQVLRIAREIDTIITMPKLKTHILTQFTGATKILFGVIPGLLKSGYHAKLRNVDNFSKMLIDLLELIQPKLSIMDGIVGMEGDGPSGGNPLKVGVVLASTDSVALDGVATSIIEMNPLFVPPLKAAIDRGLWSGSLDDINVVGESLENVRIKGFKHPSSTKESSFLTSLLYGLSKPLFIPSPKSNDNCVGCGICRVNCPVDAITISGGRAYMDLRRCIRCYCCHEMCPYNAVDLKKFWLAEVLQLP